MSNGGHLTIETQNAHLDSRYTATEVGLAAGQYVLIAITDTGVGMTAAVIAKAFDPFFTTKEVGKGTGLGLSQVYGFVKQSGGHVKIYSEVGVGTTVKLYLPRLVGHPFAPDVADAPSDLALGDEHELVLVVEDEPAVRAFTVDALSELGYRTLQADGAATALSLLREHPDVVLLFTDIVMPDVNGARLAVDVLVNNAGTSQRGPFMEVPDAMWQADLDLKLFAAIRLTRLVWPGMVERRWGRVINVLNIGAKAPKAASAPTSVSRAAGMALTKVLAGEGAPHNILVNSLHVGLIDSDQWVRRHATGQSQGSNESYGGYLADMGADVPLGRVGTAEATRPGALAAQLQPGPPRRQGVGGGPRPAAAWPGAIPAGPDYRRHR